METKSANSGGTGASAPAVEIAEFRTDSRYRLVHFRDAGWEPLAPEELEPRIRQLYPDVDPHDPEQVVWADRPWEWPAWHPGEA